MATTEIRRLTKEDIWAADDVLEQEVPVPQWGGRSALIRGVSMKQVDLIKKKATHRNQRTGKDEQDNEELTALLVVECLIDPQLTLEEYDRIYSEKSAVALSIIQKAVLDVCGLSDTVVAEADKSTGIGPDAEIPVRVGEGSEDDSVRTLDQDVRRRVRALDSAVQP